MRDIPTSFRSWIAGRLISRGYRRAALRLDPLGPATLLALRLPLDVATLEGHAPPALRAAALAGLGRLREADDLLSGPEWAPNGWTGRIISAGATFSPEWALERLPEDAGPVRAALLLALGRVEEAANAWSDSRERAPAADRAAFESALAAARGDHASARGRLNDALAASGMPAGVAIAERPMAIDTLAGEAPAQTSDSRLVTVVICVRNMADSIDAAIRSVRVQSHAALEVIVVDDASDDATRRIAARHAAEDARIRILPGDARRGLFTARNIGLRAGTGEFLTFHDADDWMHPRRLEKSVAALDAAPTALAAVFGLLRLNAKGQLCSPRIWPLVRRANASVFLRRAPALARVGMFEEVQVGADEEYLDRITSTGGKALRRGREIVIVARQDEASLTGDTATGVASPAGARLRAGYRSCWLHRHAGLPAGCVNPRTCSCGNAIE